MKKLLFLLLLLLLIWNIYKKYTDESVYFTVCDVGQGDALLFSKSYFQLLIDTGPDEKLISCLNKNIAFWDKKIDVLVLTHFDADHVAAFEELINFYQIGTIFLPLTDYKESDLYLELKEYLIALNEQGTIIKEPFLGQQIAFYDFTREDKAKYNGIEPLFFTFLTPTSIKEEKYEQLEEINAFSWQETETILSDKNIKKMTDEISENNRSIVLLLDYKDLSVLLTGDLETPGEEALLGLSLIKRVDLLKIGHHGAKTSSSLPLLLELLPETSVISVGEGNSFEHPNIEVLERISSVGSKILRTDHYGTINLVLDGEHFYLKDKKNIFH